MTITQAAPNPYCVTGADWSPGGTMTQSGMPNDSLGYIWDGLYPTNLANMVRPCKYWLSVGGGHQAWGYHEDTDTIDNPTVFGNWVTANPGKIWIIGNEPNIGSQDGLTTDQYARMFKTYYSFIRALDSTSRFAVGALASDTESDWITNDRNWWNAALQAYKNFNGGQPMPIDIWNCHGYTRAGHMDPQRVINDFFGPFRQLVDTIDGGRYAGKELWCTEFSVTLWSWQCSNQHLSEFAAQLCPRLERAGYSRFFWFLGPWDSWSGGTYQDTCLLGPTGTRTILGNTYYNLAQTYAHNGSNPVLPLPPVPPAPPAYFLDTFDGGFAGDWNVQAGDWSAVSGEYRQTRTTGAFWGVASRRPYTYQNFHIKARVRIISAPNATNWAGFTLRGGGIWDGDDPTGYLVFLRQNGAVGLYIAAENRTPVEVPGVVPDTTVFHTLHARVVGNRITVDLDGRILIDYTDANYHRMTGEVGLTTGRAQAAFDDVLVTTFVKADFDLDRDVDQEDFGRFQACYTGPGVPQNDPTCLGALMDSDNDVDLNDFAIFQRCFSGPDIVADPTCAN